MKTMLKKVLLLAFILGCGMQINALNETEDEYSTYKEYSYVLLDDGTIKITRYNGNEEFIEIPESLDGYSITSIGYHAFLYCSSLNSITLPDSITSIGDRAFGYCRGLRSITLPDSITSIGDGAFCYCDSLRSITLPDSIKEIGANPFLGCSSLKKINVSPDHPVLAIIDGLLYYKPDKRLVYCPTHKEKVTIPNGIQSIGDAAFCYCDSLSSITLPDSITSIGDYAFYNCWDLSSITLPDSITSIGNYAFFSSSSLIITVTRGSYAAQYCKKNSLQYTYTDSLDWLN